jgi:1-acyl-sn-glycerol-3-phosphate acyltransferase
VPARGPVVFAANHQSYLDPVAVGMFTRRELHYMARDSLFRNRAFARLIRTFNAFPVKRGTADVAAIKQSLRLLRDGKAILLFPEGTRTSDGAVLPMQPGAMAIARRSRAPIVPVAIDGMFEAWPRSRRFPRWKRILVAYGEPIAPETLDTLDDGAAGDLITRTVREMHNELRTRAGRRPFEYAEKAGIEGRRD